MKLKNILLTGSILCLSSTSCFAQYCHRVGIQSAIASGGILSIGVIDFTEQTEIGILASGKYNNASRQTKTITPVIFGGLRQNLWNQTYFAYGLNFADTLGRINGSRIQSNYQIGSYISLEQMLTCHIMLAGWIQPYTYEYEKISSKSTSTNNFFNKGGIAINYLF